MPNFKKFLNKKVIFVFIFVLIFISGGLFFWWQNKEIKGSVDDYIIKETTEGNIIENKKAGLSIKVPERWQTEKIEIEEGAVVIYSPDTDLEWRDKQMIFPLNKGCVFQTAITYREMTLDEIKKESKDIHFIMGVESDEFDAIVVNNYQALKNTFNIQDIGPSVGIHIPQKNKVYSFYSAWGPEEKEKCIQEFDKFLETLVIK